MGELTRVVKPCAEALSAHDTEEGSWGGALTTLRVKKHPAPSMATKSTSPSRTVMQEVVGDMMGELTRVLKQRGTAEASDTERCHVTEDTAEAAARAEARAEAKAKAEAVVKARCQLAHVFAEEAAAGALQQGEEEISPTTQTIKGKYPQTKYFESLPPPAVRHALDLSTTVGEVQGGRQLGGNPKPAFLTELRQVLQKGSHGAEPEEGGGGDGAWAARPESQSVRWDTTNTPAAASAKAEGRALRHTAQRLPPGPIPAPAGGMQDLMGELTRVLKQRGAAETTAATAAAPVTRRPSFGRKKRPGQGEAAAGEMPVAPQASSTPEPPPPATAATAATASVVTRRLSFGRKTKTKEKQPSGQVETAEPGAVPMASDEPSTAEPPPPATAATAAASATPTVTVAGVTVGAVKVAAASVKVHQIDAFLNHCQARHAMASGVMRLAMIEEDNEQDEKEAVPVEPDESSAPEPPPPRQESFSRAAARAAAAVRKAAVVATVATSATAATASVVARRRPSFERAPLATKLTVEARRLTVELEGCLEKGLGLGLDASNRITEIKPAGQAAASRKLLLGDVVVSVNGTALEGHRLQHVMRPGVALTLEVERGGGGFRRTRQLSFERKAAKQKREEAAMRKEAARAEAEKVVNVMETVSGGSDGGASGTPCATFAVAAAAAADLFATIAAAAELSADAAASDDADEASANVSLRVPLSALSRARQHAVQHHAQHRQPASTAATLTARQPHFLETRPGPPPPKRSPWVAAKAATASAVARQPSFGRKKRLTGPGGTQAVGLEAPTNEDDGLDEDLTV